MFAGHLECGSGSIESRRLRISNGLRRTSGGNWGENVTRGEEQRLIDRVLAGETDNFAELVTAHERTVYNLCLRMTGSREDASDLSQEAFLKAYKSLAKFKRESRFSVWLYRLATNTCIDFLRKEGRRKESLTYEDESGAIREWEVADERYSPFRLLEQKELQKDIQAGLKGLSDDHRRILIMREIGGLSYGEIAEALELSEGTVKSRLSRARSQLAGFLTRGGNLSDRVTSKKKKDKGR